MSKKYKKYYIQNNLSREVLDKNRKKGEHTFNYKGLDFIIKKNVFSPEIFNGNKLFTAVLEKEIKNNSSLLEIGSGSGVTGLYLAKVKDLVKITLTDINHDAVENSRENAKKLGLIDKVQVLQSDVFDQIPKYKYDIIYWNHPWLPEEDNYEYKDQLDKGLFDPNYKYLTKYIAGLKKYSHINTRIFLGFGDFGDIAKLKKICNNYGYQNKELARKNGNENGNVKFILFEIKSN